MPARTFWHVAIGKKKNTKSHLQLWFVAIPDYSIIYFPPLNRQTEEIISYIKIKKGNLVLNL